MRTKFLTAMQRTLLAAICFVSSTGAWAATVRNSAYIDLTSLNIISVAGNATLGLSPFYSSVETTINDNDDFSEDTNAGSVVLFSDNGAFVEASAASDQDTLLSQVDVEPEGFAAATALYEIEYTASGNGEVKIGVDYTLDANASDLNDSIVSSYGLVELLDEASNSSSEASIFNEGLLSDPTNDFGTLNLTLMLQDGDTGFLQFTAASNSFSEVAPVPVPPAFLLFFSSLLGLFITRRPSS